MKKIIVFALLLSIFTGVAANAQFRMDVNISVPVYWGFQQADIGSFGDFAQFAFVIPELDLYYQFDLGMVKLGLGARIFTLILESILVPDFFAEFHLDPIIIRGSVCGGAALLFGLYSDVVTGALIIPDVNVMVKLADFFRLGAGCTFIMNLEYLDTGLIFIPYVGARFTFVFGGDEGSSE